MASSYNAERTGIIIMRLFIFYIIIFIGSTTSIWAEENLPSLNEYKNIKEGILINEVVRSSNNINKANSNIKHKITVDDLMDFYKSGNYKIIKDNIFSFTIKKDSKAEELLGIMYKNGQGFKKDMSKALIWLGKAADAKEPLAQYHLGVIYYTGESVKRDLSKSLMWLKLAYLYYNKLEDKKLVQNDYNDVFSQTGRRDRNRSKELLHSWLKSKNDLYILNSEH